MSSGTAQRQAGWGDTVRAEQDWTLEAATDQERPLLARLLQFYLHDFSEFDHEPVDELGRFAYDDEGFARFWTEPDWHALLLRVGGRPAGFVLLRERGTGPLALDRNWIAEFFVMRAYRGRGLGRAMARAVFDRFSGPWQVGQTATNTPARAFWRRVIGEYTGGRYEERRARSGGYVQEFDTHEKAER